MHNPDFPAPIKKKIFILDYDAYYDGFVERTEVETRLTLFHDKIQDLFEWSIQPKLREIMKNG